MKRVTATVIGVFALLLFVSSPAHAIKVLVATIALGEVQVGGVQAKKNSNITWEGNIVTQSNKLGLFKFSTTNLPIDCVGELSDGVSTIPVVIFGCTTEQLSGGGVLKTGQIQCETSDAMGGCPGNPAGQDGELQKGTARSYTDNGDGTITDNSTGLIWEKLADDGSIHDWDNTYNWDDAFLVKIATLNTAPCFAGHCDWRLPNVNELQTLVNYGNVSPAVDAAFNNGVDSFTQSSVYWSSTTYQGGPDGAWDVNCFDGSVFAFSKFNISFVRAVRGGS
jgi:hypothetical protein